MKVLLGLLFMAVCSAAGAKTLHVGVLLNIKESPTGLSLYRGIQTAALLFKKKTGHDVKLSYVTHVIGANGILTASDVFLKTDKVTAVIGGELSEEAIVLGDKFNSRKIVYITPTASNPQVTEQKPYVFRTCFSDDQVVQPVARFVLEKLRPARLGIIHDVSTSYSEYLGRQFSRAFEKALVKAHTNPRPVSVEHRVTKNTSEYGPIVKDLMAKKVSDVAILTEEDDISKFITAAQKQNYYPTYIGGDGIGTSESIRNLLVEHTPRARNFMAYRYSYWKDDPRNPMTVDFKEIYQSKFKGKPDDWSAIGFDTGWVLFNAMAKAPSPENADQVRDELEKTNDLRLLTSEHFSFGSSHNPKKDLYMYKITRSGIALEEVLK